MMVIDGAQFLLSSAHLYDYFSQYLYVSWGQQDRPFLAAYSFFHTGSGPAWYGTVQCLARSGVKKAQHGTTYVTGEINSLSSIFSARCNIYISRLCYDVSVRLSVRLSVTEVHWHIIANLGFKFRSHFTAHCGRRAACGRIISRHASQC